MRRIFGILFVMMACAVTAQEPESNYFDIVGKADEAISLADWSSAEARLLEAMRLEPANPMNPLLMSNLGIVRSYMGRDSLALATLTDAQAMAPGSTRIMINRGRVLMGMGHDAEAIESFTSALEVDSMITEARFCRGWLALKNGDLMNAERDFAFLQMTDPDSEDTLIGLSSLHTAKGEYEAALPYLDKLLSSSPTAEFYGQRALCYLMLNRLAEASEDISRGLASDPEDAELYLYRAILNKSRYRNEDSRADARRALELGMPQSSVAPYL